MIATEQSSERTVRLLRGAPSIDGHRRPLWGVSIVERRALGDRIAGAAG